MSAEEKMRGKPEGFQTKDLVDVRPVCFRAHKNYCGASCPECGLPIPRGPFTPEERAEYFDDGVRYIETKMSQREITMRAELAALTERVQAAKEVLASATGLRARNMYASNYHQRSGLDEASAIENLEVVERDWHRLNREVRHFANVGWPD